MNAKILTICLNPVIQKTILLPALHENEVNRSNEYYTDASGKGINVTRVLTQLGADVVHLTQLGGRFREFFLGLVGSDRLNIAWVESFSEIRSAYTLISQARKTTTEIVEEALPVDSNTESRVMKKFRELLPPCAAIIISGTKAAGFSTEIFPEMVRLAKKQDKIVVIDFRGRDLINSLQFKPDFIKPNYQEFVATFFPEAVEAGKIDASVTTEVHTKMLELARQFGTTTILTQGGGDIQFVGKDQICSRTPEKIIPVNTIGCGDAFCAGFTAKWLQQNQLVAAIDKGIECAKRNALLRRPGVIE